MMNHKNTAVSNLGLFVLRVRAPFDQNQTKSSSSLAIQTCILPDMCLDASYLASLGPMNHLTNYGTNFPKEQIDHYHEIQQTDISSFGSVKFCD